MHGMQGTYSLGRCLPSRVPFLKYNGHLLSLVQQVKIVGLLLLSTFLLGEGREFTPRMLAGCVLTMAGFAIYRCDWARAQMCSVDEVTYQCDVRARVNSACEGWGGGWAASLACLAPVKTWPSHSYSRFAGTHHSFAPMFTPPLQHHQKPEAPQPAADQLCATLSRQNEDQEF